MKLIMEIRKRIGVGKSSLVYRTENNTALKVFYSGLKFEDAERIAENMQFARDHGVNVPYPLNVKELTLTPEHIKNLSLFERHSILLGHVYSLRNLIGKTFPAIEEELIEGQNLMKRWLPSRRINRQIRDIRQKIRGLDMYVIDDMMPWNYILTSNKEVFLVDCVGLRKNKSKEFSPFFMNELARFLTPTSKIDLVLATLLHFFLVG